MSEKRKLKRRNFIFDIEVNDRSRPVDPDTNSHVIGDLADITVEGMMVVSEAPLPEKTDFQLRIYLPEPIRGQRHIDFDAVSIRCKKTIHESIYTTGFRITRLDEANGPIITELIDEYAV
jgi:hypothetical protein